MIILQSFRGETESLRSEEKRPIHCIDKPRRKIMLRENDEWIIDFAGKKMLQGTYPLIRKLFPIHPGTPLKELVFNTKQLIDMACGKRLVANLNGLFRSRSVMTKS